MVITAFCIKANAQGESHAANDPNFSMKCPSGQYLRYTITSNEEPYAVTLNGIKNDDGTTKKLEIPTTVHYRNIDFAVTKINQAAFRDMENLVSVVIPKTVKTIGSEAFYGCKSLKTIKTSSDLEHIGENAFYGTAITSPLYTGKTLVYYPAKSTEYKINNGTTAILEYAFNGCSELTSINIPASVSTIYPNSFANCEKLESITVEPGNKTYDSKYNCNSIISVSDSKLILSCGKSNIPEGVKIIGRTAFMNSQITSIDIPNSVTIIEDSAFYGCKLEKVTIPQHVESIGKYAFSRSKKLAVVNFNAENCHIADKEHPIFDGCIALTSVNFGESVKTVPAYGFKGCAELRFATLSNSIIEIGDEAFADCTMLSYIEIPNSVENVYGSAFSGTALTEPISTDKIFIYLPKEYGAKYSIPSGIKTIAPHAFYDNEKLTSLTIPNTVTTISEYAFDKASGLKSLTIPNSVTKIGKNAFRYCAGLTSITLSNSLTIIEDETFSSCARLKSVVIPNSVTSIGKEIVYWCDSFENITLPNSVANIDPKAFYGCETIKHIYVPKGSKEKFKKMIDASLHKIIIEK